MYRYAPLLTVYMIIRLTMESVLVKDKSLAYSFHYVAELVLLNSAAIGMKRIDEDCRELQVSC